VVKRLARKKKVLLQVKIGLKIEKHIIIGSSDINKNLLEGCWFVRDYCSNVIVVMEVMICRW
jgi:hypothetical protein